MQQLNGKTSTFVELLSFLDKSLTLKEITESAADGATGTKPIRLHETALNDIEKSLEIYFNKRTALDEKIKIFRAKDDEKINDIRLQFAALSDEDKKDSKMEKFYDQKISVIVADLTKRVEKEFESELKEFTELDKGEVTISLRDDKLSQIKKEFEKYGVDKFMNRKIYLAIADVFDNAKEV